MPHGPPFGVMLSVAIVVMIAIGVLLGMQSAA
jgi:hypothetical protein